LYDLLRVVNRSGIAKLLIDRVLGA
jgi:hypothetical protein